MVDFDTAPGALDDDRHRRGMDKRIDQIVNSSALKLLQYIFTMVLVPAGVLFINNLQGEIAGMRTTLQAYAIKTALYDREFEANRASYDRLLARMATLEAAMQNAQSYDLKHDYDIRRLQDATPALRPR